MQHDSRRMIHICGMYKSGTSWLLNMLSAHPQLIGWREFDPILASHRRPLTGRARQLLEMRRVAGGGALAGFPDLRWQPRGDRDLLRCFFGGEGWILQREPGARRAARGVLDRPPPEMLAALLEFAGARLRPDDAPSYRPADMQNMLGFRNCRHGDTLALLKDLQQAHAAETAPDRFWHYLQRQCAAGTTVVMKSANQELALPLLLRLSPGSRRVAIIRDGRDAALSARHFRRLMRDWDAPNAPSSRGLDRMLLGWALRVEVLLWAAARGEILLIRYEDLLDRPQALFAALLRRLDLDASPALVESVCEQTSFESATGGRKPGEEAPDLVRRGQPGEWLERLPERERARAWRRAGATLARAGYAPSGHALATPALFLCG